MFNKIISQQNKKSNIHAFKYLVIQIKSLILIELGEAKRPKPILAPPWDAGKISCPISPQHLCGVGKTLAGQSVLGQGGEKLPSLAPCLRCGFAKEVDEGVGFGKERNNLYFEVACFWPLDLLVVKCLSFV